MRYVLYFFVTFTPNLGSSFFCEYHRKYIFIRNAGFVGENAPNLISADLTGEALVHFYAHV